MSFVHLVRTVRNDSVWIHAVALNSQRPAQGVDL